MSAIGAARISGHGVATTKTASARTGSPETAHATTGDDSRRPAGRRRRSDRRSGRRAPAPAGLLDQPHERGVGALRRRAQRAQLERRAGAARPASHLPAAADRDRQRLAGERRLVDASPRRSRPSRRRGRPRPRGRAHGRRARRPPPAPRPARSPRRTSAVRGARSTSEVSSRAARRFARSSSALPPASISATTAPARYSPSASAPAIETSAIASTPTSRFRSERTTEIVSGTSSSAVVAAQNPSATDRAPAAHAAIPPTTPASAARATNRRAPVGAPTRPSGDLRDVRSSSLLDSVGEGLSDPGTGGRSGPTAVLTKRPRGILPFVRFVRTVPPCARRGIGSCTGREYGFPVIPPARLSNGIQDPIERAETNCIVLR